MRHDKHDKHNKHGKHDSSRALQNLEFTVGIFIKDYYKIKTRMDLCGGDIVY